MPNPLLLVRKMLASIAHMDAGVLHHRSPSLGDVDNWFALGAGAFLLIVGATRRSTAVPASRWHPHHCCIAASLAAGQMS
jgi:hypothetical protein